MCPDYFLAREIRKKVNLASECCLVLGSARDLLWAVMSSCESVTWQLDDPATWPAVGPCPSPCCLLLWSLLLQHLAEPDEEGFTSVLWHLLTTVRWASYQRCKLAMTYPISHLRPDYFLAREIRKKVNLASESPLVLWSDGEWSREVWQPVEGCDRSDRQEITAWLWKGAANCIAKRLLECPAR